MALFQWIVALIAVSLLLTAIARKLSVPYPALLALGGAALTFIPGSPRFDFDPDLALALFVAPVLLDSAFDSSLRDLKDNRFPIGSLVLGALALTVLSVACVVRWLVPEIPWSAACALGAIVSPPDASAAIAALRQLRPPHRIMTILEGESLLNDAIALVIFRVAVGITMGSNDELGAQIGFNTIGIFASILAGPALAWLAGSLIKRIDDEPSSILTQFVSTFGVWLLAEHLHLSPVLTMVSYAVTLARTSSRHLPARLRVSSYAVWDTLVLLLNVLAFALVGLQMAAIFDELDVDARETYLRNAAIVLGTVIAVRFLWVMLNNAVARWRVQRRGFHPPRPMIPPTVQGGLLVSWCGMRGIVSLASALALPAHFPMRDLIVFTTAVVVLGTLTLQGFSLPVLLRALRFPDDDPVANEVRTARIAAYRAALVEIDGNTTKPAQVLRWELSEVLRQTEDGPSLDLPLDDLRRRVAYAARTAIHEMRSDGTIGDAAYHSIEEEFDAVELAVHDR